MKAKIVQLDSKCLHLTVPNVTYVGFHSRPVNADNCGVEFSFRIKGKGSVQPMHWFMLKDSGRWSYYGGKPVTLTDEWQTVTLWRSCPFPDLDYVTCAFGIHPGSDFYVDDLAMRLVTTTK